MADFDITITDNADWSMVVTYETAGGAPIDLTGYTAIMTLRTHPAASVAMLQLSSAAGEISINAALGMMTVSVTSAQAATLTQGRGVYDLMITNLGGSVTRIVGGTVTIESGVT